MGNLRRIASVVLLVVALCLAASAQTFTCPANKVMAVYAAAVDQGGNATTPASTPTWTVADPTVLSVAVDPNHASLWAVVHPLKTGTTTITVSALDHVGGNTKSTVFTVTVTPGELDHFVITADPPQ